MPFVRKLGVDCARRRLSLRDAGAGQRNRVMEDAVKGNPVLVLALLPAGIAAAQEMAYVDVPVQGRENVSYAYADVLRAIPTYEINRIVEQVVKCDDEPADAAKPSTEAPSDAAPASSAAEPGLPAGCRRETIEREERRISGYEVEYRYKGELYMSRMDVDPGNKLRIRVTVAPAD